MDFRVKIAPGAGAKKKLRHKAIIVCFVAAALLFAFGVGGIYGKYTHQSTGDGLVTAQEFYFESNMLDEADAFGDYPGYELAAGTVEISFSLENFADELRFTGHEIRYTLSAVDGDNVPVTVTDANGGKLAGGAKTSADVTISGLESGKTYTVTASTDGGYAKTIGARFTVTALSSGVYAWLDTASDSHYVELNVWTENMSANVTVTAPAGLIPDTTRGVEASNTIELAANGSVKYRYFKEDTSASFTLFDFTVSATSGANTVPVQTKTPG